MVQSQLKISKHILQFFFFAGTDVNAVDKTGLTPLAWAAAHRQVTRVNNLIEIF